MDINVKTFHDAIVEGNYETFETTVTEAAAEKDIHQALAPVFAAVDQALAAGQLIQSRLVITGKENVVVRIETGIINLPFEDTKKVINFLELEELVPLKLYLIVAAADLNVSGLRIDLIATAADYLTTKAAQQEEVAAAVLAKLATIKANAAAPKPEPAKKPAAKTTTRKTAARKPTARTTAAKKPTTRKPKAKEPKA